MDWKRLIVIIVVFVIYLCLGSVIFNALEAESERKRASELKEQYASFLANNTCVNQAELLILVQRIIVDSGLALHVASNLTDDLDRWDFSGSFGFAVSVVTTIGYGNMAPHTLIGKAVCVAYALLGIPLTLIMLNAMGARLALVLARINKLQLCSHKPLINKVVNMLIILTLGCLVMFVAPAFMFNRVEGWNFVESLYFCFITLSTIGFGDYIIGNHQPQTSISQVQNDIYQVAAYVWILFGLAYLTLMVKYITDVLVKNAGKVEKKTMRILESEVNRLQSGILSGRLKQPVVNTISQVSELVTRTSTPSSSHAAADVVSLDVNDNRQTLGTPQGGLLDFRRSLAANPGHSSTQTRRRPASPEGTLSRDGSLPRSGSPTRNNSSSRNSNAMPNGILPTTSPPPRNGSRSRVESMTGKADLTTAGSNRNPAGAFVLEDSSPDEGSSIATANYAFQEWPASAKCAATVGTTRDENGIERSQL